MLFRTLQEKLKYFLERQDTLTLGLNLISKIKKTE
jgi:hypothetical protein